uniref:Transmembrane protein 214 n=1 Tax=Anser brachyrhynchus TaxID=132585 RepID=A0A8B9CSU1_9AVES
TEGRAVGAAGWEFLVRARAPTPPASTAGRRRCPCPAPALPAGALPARPPAAGGSGLVVSGQGGQRLGPALPGAPKPAPLSPCSGLRVSGDLCRPQLDVADLQKELDKSQSMFPENPSVWVKDLAGYLNYKLQAPKSDPTLSQHAHGESLHGYRICIQAVLLDRPKIATANLGKYLELLRSHQNRPAKCLTILWALGQAGFADLAEGLRVWLGVMLPVLGIKALSPYAVAYLDRLLTMHPNLTKGFGMIGPKDFFPLLDFAFMPNNSLPPSLQEQLRRLYPRLKVLALGARPEATLHTYFPSFLSRATPSCPPAMRKELLTSMSQCLSVDPLSFSVWRQLYTKHLSQSSLLLNHLLESWDNGSRKARQSLQETVRSFKVTNEELAARGPGSEQDVAACDAACKVLLQKMKGGGFPWSRLLLIGLVFAVGFLMHDVRTHGSLQASTSARVLRSSGILSASQQAWHKASHYSLEGYRWLESTLPACCSRGAAALQPALQLLWAKTAELALRVSELCSSHLSWLQSRVPEAVLHFAECVRELLLFLLRSCLLPLLEHGAAALQRGWERCRDACHGEVSWDCLRAHLTSFTYSSWVYLQNTTLAVTNWASAMISGH